MTIDRETDDALAPAWVHHNRLRHTTKDPAAALAFAQLVADDAEKMLIVSAWHARKAGLSWSQIGDALGVSKQAAQQKYGRHCGDS